MVADPSGLYFSTSPWYFWTLLSLPHSLHIDMWLYRGKACWVWMLFGLTSGNHKSGDDQCKTWWGWSLWGITWGENTPLVIWKDGKSPASVWIPAVSLKYMSDTCAWIWSGTWMWCNMLLISLCETDLRAFRRSMKVIDSGRFCCLA